MMTMAKKRRAPRTPIPVRFGADELGFLRLMEARANAEQRSVSGQLKYYARLGMAKDNPICRWPSSRMCWSPRRSPRRESASRTRGA